MQTLIVNAHPDPQAQDSATYHMVQRLLGHLPSGSAQVLNLADADVLPLDKALRTVFTKTVFTQEPLDAAEQALMTRTASLVAQLKEAARLVIATPMYNFSIPAPLQQWLDNIVVPGQTFHYNEEGQPQGLMGEHKALVLLSSGGIDSQGDFAHMDFATPYLQSLLGPSGLWQRGGGAR